MSRWVWQQVYADPHRGDGHRADGMPGDCFRACLASLLEVPLESVDHAVLAPTPLWWARARRFVRRYTEGSMDLLSIAPPWPGQPVYDAPGPLQGVVMAAGKSWRGAFGHVVLVDQADGHLVHDPHPLGRGVRVMTHVYALTTAEQGDELEPLPAQLALTAG